MGLRFHLSPTLLLVLGALCTVTQGYSVYRERIPNGLSVPHPCKPNYLWKGVGHVNPLGGGSKNAFGADFLRFGAQWSVEFCQHDSDGDGKTNGQELGDPECTWTPGTLPSRTSGITHPGVCDPWEDAMCKVLNAWIDCDIETLDCPILTSDPEIQNITLRFPPTPVPNTETNYMCMTFDLPSDDVYDLVASEPAIDNAQVMHHILLHSCEDVKEPPTIATPGHCGMEAGSGCRGIIAGWTVGSPGNCLSDQYGYRFGKGLYTRVVLEFHWNNPELRSDYTDGSGLTLYYTRTLRPNKAATLVLGQVEIMIPPQQPSVQITGSCPAECSRVFFDRTFYVSSATNHMHYLGKSQKVELYRDGRKVTDITNDEVFSYDSPTFMEHNPPIEVRPGDELRTTCVYDSRTRNQTVLYGDGTSDEMCFAFLTVYPKEALHIFPACVAFGQDSICQRYLSPPGGEGGEGGEGEGGGVGERTTTVGSVISPDGSIDGCHWQSFTNQTSPAYEAMFTELYITCEAFGRCKPECAAFLRGLRDNPCLHGNAWEKVKGELVGTHSGMLTIAYIQSCPLVFCTQCPQC